MCAVAQCLRPFHADLWAYHPLGVPGTSLHVREHYSLKGGGGFAICSSWGAAGQVSAGCTANRTQVGSLLPRKAGSLNDCLVLAQHWYWPPPPQRRCADASCLLGRAQTCERSTAISSGIQMLPPPHAKLLQAKTIVAANLKATRESTGRGAGPPTYAQRCGRPGEVGLQRDQHL